MIPYFSQSYQEKSYLLQSIRIWNFVADICCEGQIRGHNLQCRCSAQLSCVSLFICRKMNSSDPCPDMKRETVQLLESSKRNQLEFEYNFVDADVWPTLDQGRKQRRTNRKTGIRRQYTHGRQKKSNYRWCWWESFYDTIGKWSSGVTWSIAQKRAEIDQRQKSEELVWLHCSHRAYRTVLSKCKAAPKFQSIFTNGVSKPSLRVISRESN